MKYKVGDKVKILPCAITFSIPESMVGEIVTISAAMTSGYYVGNYIVTCKKDTTKWYTSYRWNVRPTDIKSLVRKGEQLLFSFMEEE